jgi:hypothetical protein
MNEDKTLKMPDDPLSKEWLLERLAAEVCCNPKGSERIAALKLLEQIRNTANPFNDELTLEQRVSLLKQLLTPDDIFAVVSAMNDTERKRILEKLQEVKNGNGTGR